MLGRFSFHTFVWNNNCCIKTHFRMKKNDIPEWARAMRTRNTEVRCVAGRYYLYRVRCVYDREEKKRRKTAEYLGALVEGVGLIPRGSREDALRGGAASGQEERIRELEARIRELEAENARLRAGAGPR